VIHAFMMSDRWESGQCQINTGGPAQPFKAVTESIRSRWSL